MNESRLRRLRDKASGAATLINEGCKITGSLTGNGDFMVKNTFENLSQTVIIIFNPGNIRLLGVSAGFIYIVENLQHMLTLFFSMSI